jgi:hypothetical protein
MLQLQIGLSEWPESLNEQIAMFDSTPSEISQFSGIKFDKSFDSLDEFEGAVIRIGAHVAGLIFYHNSPVSGVVAVVPGFMEKKEKKHLLLSLMKIAGLSESQVLWRPEDSDP